jgi:hypothetical protein
MIRGRENPPNESQDYMICDGFVLYSHILEIQHET